MTVQFSIDLDGIVEFALYNGLVAIPHATYSEYYLPGKHFVTIFYPDIAEEQERKNLRVLVRAYKQESSIVRNQEAEIATLQNAIDAIKTATDLSNLTYTVVEPDDTEPTVYIAAQEVKAIIYAQGISTKAEWSGDLEFTDHIGLVEITNSTMMEFHDAMNSVLCTPVSNVISENISLIALNNTTVIAFTESFIENEVIDNYTIEPAKAEFYQYDKQYVNTEDTFSLKTVYDYQSKEETIDSGKMVEVEIDLTVFASVVSLEVT